MSCSVGTPAAQELSRSLVDHVCLLCRSYMNVGHARLMTVPVRLSHAADEPMCADLAELFGRLELEHPVLRQPVCLVVLGADEAARTGLVAALLGEPLLPSPPPPGAPSATGTGAETAGTVWPPLVVRGACDDFAVLLEERAGLRRQTDLAVVFSERGRRLQPPRRTAADAGTADSVSTVRPCRSLSVGYPAGRAGPPPRWSVGVLCSLPITMSELATGTARPVKYLTRFQ